MNRQRSTILLAAVLLLAMTACRDKQLADLAKVTRSVYEACNVLTDDVMKMGDQKIITPAQEKSILTALRKVLVADRAVNSMIEPLSKLEAGSKLDMLNIVEPLLTALDDAIQNDLVTITDPQLRTKLTDSFIAIKLSIRSLILILR